MKNFKIILNNRELILPINDCIYDAIIENSNSLTPLSSEFASILRGQIKPSYESAYVVVGDTSFEFPFESYLLNFLSANSNALQELDQETIEELGNVLRKTVPLSERPATSKQINYAMTIAQTIGIDLPYEVLRYSANCSAFIDKNNEEFQSIMQEQRQLMSQVNRVSKWLAAHTMYENGDSLGVISEKLNVVRVSTVENYLVKFQEWQNDFEQQGDQYKKVFINQLHAVMEAEYPDL